MSTLSRIGLVLLLLIGCSDTPPDRGTPRPGPGSSSGASIISTTFACGKTFETLVRCKALLSFPPSLRAYLGDIPVSRASKVPGALAAYYFIEDRIEISPRLSEYGEAWAILTMRHEFVHALSWRMPGYREDARALFARLRDAIATAEADRHAFPKYDQWLRAHPEYVEDLPHFITGIVELMSPGEMPASLDSYFARLLSAMPRVSTH